MRRDNQQPRNQPPWSLSEGWPQLLLRVWRPLPDIIYLRWTLPKVPSSVIVYLFRFPFFHRMIGIRCLQNYRCLWILSWFGGWLWPTWLLGCHHEGAAPHKSLLLWTWCLANWSREVFRVCPLSKLLFVMLSSPVHELCDSSLTSHL